MLNEVQTIIADHAWCAMHSLDLNKLLKVPKELQAVLSPVAAEARARAASIATAVASSSSAVSAAADKDKPDRKPRSQVATVTASRAASVDSEAKRGGSHSMLSAE